uniref:Alternative protein ARL13B n=1 Tax=Homo sapiens TaxID=9606 RepID=L0R6C8_HUMAN|nr:alternative protein ARL13B [Homo sapiens]
MTVLLRVQRHPHPLLLLAGEPLKSLDFQNLSLLVKHIIMISIGSHCLPWLCHSDLTVMLMM